MRHKQFHSFKEKANSQNQKIVSELKEMCEKAVIDEIDNSTTSLRQSVLNDLILNLEQTTLDEVRN